MPSSHLGQCWQYSGQASVLDENTGLLIQELLRILRQQCQGIKSSCRVVLRVASALCNWQGHTPMMFDWHTQIAPAELNTLARHRVLALLDALGGIPLKLILGCPQAHVASEFEDITAVNRVVP